MAGAKDRSGGRRPGSGRRPNAYFLVTAGGIESVAREDFYRKRPRVRETHLAQWEFEGGNLGKRSRKKRGKANWRSVRRLACARCGGSFVAKLPHERFCCRTCGTAANNRAKQEAARDRSPRPCRFCATVFTPGYGEFRSHYCSALCLKKRQNMATSGKNYVRRARRYGAVVQKVDRLQVFARDGWKCRFCGIKTPREMLGTAANNAPHLDHEPPLSRGGSHTYPGTQLLCASCNLIKRDRTMDELAAALAA